ncbi:hypothetical protein P4U99_23090 [Brevibacillus agri]|uniref:Uncharacterized protein n=1 Tax=Brevibacillus agri TaxID=51101 RepID=A0A3M8B8U2_9BACL|nr:hypothetical protein [Brevibacillus agri]MED1646038.1 hypothetical protein [Brevibacillus agri]MED1656180.1 hypothetical protein [Brevibacillus agri]MED1689671.1 hypothetical protein [Brevibacillus agri]MED1691644.1 hypothetical protein [Brevibacillus agri]MED1699136.1 hypothetical protein [Brevibacillus agri]
MQIVQKKNGLEVYPVEGQPGTTSDEEGKQDAFALDSKVSAMARCSSQVSGANEILLFSDRFYCIILNRINQPLWLWSGGFL